MSDEARPRYVVRPAGEGLPVDADAPLIDRPAGLAPTRDEAAVDEYGGKVDRVLRAELMLGDVGRHRPLPEESVEVPLSRRGRIDAVVERDDLAGDPALCRPRPRSPRGGFRLERRDVARM